VSVTLATVTWGPTDDLQAPRALLVHGITSSAATMWELGEGLAAHGWAVTAVDLPGHGDSGPADSYRFADVADAIAAQVGDGFELYVGHSLGGAVGTALLARHPGTARRAVLIDPALVAPEDRVSDIPDQLVADKGLTVDEVAAAHPHWHPRTVASRVAATAAADVTAVRRWLLDNRPWDVRAEAAAVTVPVHVLVASDDAAVAPFLVDDLPAANPLWTFETVPDSTHSIHRDQPELVLQRLLG
jgi:pimeloyl-ACP methyl ester carboxylesterase